MYKKILFIFCFFIVSCFCFAQNQIDSIQINSASEMNNRAVDLIKADQIGEAMTLLERCIRLYSSTEICVENRDVLRQQEDLSEINYSVFGYLYELGYSLNQIPQLIFQFLILLLLGGAFYFLFKKKRISWIAASLLGAFVFIICNHAVSKYKFSNELYIVKSKELNIKSSPYESAEDEARVYAGQLVKKISVYEDWWEVDSEQYERGWIKRENVIPISDKN